MKLEVTVSEIADIFKAIQERPGQLFEMIRLDIKEVCREIPDDDDECGADPFSGERALCSGFRGAVIIAMVPMVAALPSKGSAKSMWIFLRDRNGEFKTSGHSPEQAV